MVLFQKMRRKRVKECTNYNHHHFYLNLFKNQFNCRACAAEANKRYHSSKLTDDRGLSKNIFFTKILYKHDLKDIYMSIYNCTAEVCVLLNNLIDVCGNQFARYSTTLSFTENRKNPRMIFSLTGQNRNFHCALVELLQKKNTNLQIHKYSI